MRGRESHRGHATSGGLYAVLATILREVVVPPQIENELGILYTWLRAPESLGLGMSGVPPNLEMAAGIRTAEIAAPTCSPESRGRDPGPGCVPGAIFPFAAHRHRKKSPTLRRRFLPLKLDNQVSSTPPNPNNTRYSFVTSTNYSQNHHRLVHQPLSIPSILQFLCHWFFASSLSLSSWTTISFHSPHVNALFSTLRHPLFQTTVLTVFEFFRRQDSAAHVLDSLDPNTSDSFPFGHLGSVSFLIRVQNDTNCRATCSVLLIRMNAPSP